MITLKDYNFLYSDVHYHLPAKKNLKTSNDLPFYYLYPSEVEPLQKNIYYNQKQQLFTLTLLQDVQQSQKTIELIKNKNKVFSPSLEFIVAQHKNPNAIKKLIVVSSIDRQHTLRYISQNCFFQNAKVPNELFCSNLIQKMLMFVGILEQKGFHLKLITPEHIICFEDRFYLAYPFPHDLNESSIRLFEKLQKNENFCAPQILKVLQNSKPSVNKQSNQQIYVNGVINNSATLSINLQPRGFKKAILYSLALSILYVFGYQIPAPDRYLALRNPRHLNNHLDQLRKQIKIHHDGKYISKLLKLMLEHSESLRDTINTFLYKMNSTQFRLLKKIFVKSLTNQKEQNIRTESEINSNPMLRTSSGKKTIDIRISSMSNASSSINQSWLSGSQRENEKMMSPFDMNKSFTVGEQYPQKSKSKRQITPKDLNMIEQEKNKPGSPIEFDIDWDQDTSARESNKSSSLRRSKKKSENQSLDDEKKSPIGKIFNKISEKEENEDEADIRQEKNPIKPKSKDNQSNIKISQEQANDQLVITKQKEDHRIYRSQLGIKAVNSVEEHFKTQPQIEQEILQESDYRVMQMKICQHNKQQPINKNQNCPLNYFKLNQQLDYQGNEKCQQTFNNIFYSEQNTFQQPKFKENLSSQLNKNNEQSQMTLYVPSALKNNVDSISLNESTTFEMNGKEEMNNESFIFEQSFGDGQEFQAHQLFLKKAKSKQKDKLTQRKKDQYNQRSRIILVTLVVIYAVFELIEWLLNRQQSV